MTDGTNYGADALTTLEQIEGTYVLDGEEYDLVVEDLRKEDIDTLQELQRLTERVREGEAVADDAVPSFSFEAEDDDRDWVAILVDHKLVKPDVDPDEMTIRGLRAVIEGMADCWGVDEDIQQARGQMPVEGNR